MCECGTVRKTDHVPVMQGEPGIGKAGSSGNQVLNFDIYLGAHLIASNV